MSIVLSMNLDMDLEKLLDKVFEVHLSKDEELKKKILEFISQRLKVTLEGEGIKYDVCEAVLGSGANLIETYCKSFILNNSLSKGPVKGIIMCADRISRIAGQAQGSNPDTDLFADDGEKKLYSGFLQIKDLFNEAMAAKDYDKALLMLANLTPLIEEFFEKVLVMHQDENIRKNRLALLKEVNGLYLRFADFGRIVI